ncbi:hypothetical protein HED60_04635 [Planctomycetales bacterium ZRK34]|nr:hypothetical protein HED60_04635 [Planctomycetales bacterium ZRK34]
MNMSFRAFTIASTCFVAILLACTAHAQTKVQENGNTPEAVAARAMASLKENRIADFTGMMHPEALRQTKTVLLDIVDAAEKANQADQVMILFSDVPSTQALRDLDDASLFIAFLKGVMKIQPQIRNALQNMTVEIIGHVAEGPDVAHVVYRGSMSQQGITITKLAVMSFKSNGAGWGMLMTGDLEAMTAGLKLRFQSPN